MNIKSAIWFQLLVVFNINAFAQFGGSSEIGVIAGPVFFQSDYGARYDVSSNLANNGFGIGVFHVANFENFSRLRDGRFTTYFMEHFKLRTELSYQKSDFSHKGRWVEGGATIGKEQLRAMRGSAAVTNVGMQLEWFPWGASDLDRSISKYNFAPFISFGAQYNIFNTKSTSTLGPVDAPGVLFPKFIGAARSEISSTFSLVSSVGALCKISDQESIVLDLRWQHYFSDWVDGLNVNSQSYPENRSNDMMFWVNVGYIYRFE